MEASKLTLGTVQFGMNYGIANTQGKPSFEKVCGILAAAYENGIRFLDTAAGYGDSEIVLGKALKDLHAVVFDMPGKISEARMLVACNGVIAV